MGCTASKMVVDPFELKDADSRELDEVDMDTVWVPDLDNTFSNVADVENLVADLNNDTLGAQEATKTLWTTLGGAYYVKAKADLGVELYATPGPEEEGEDKPVAEGTDAMAKAAIHPVMLAALAKQNALAERARDANSAFGKSLAPIKRGRHDRLKLDSSAVKSCGEEIDDEVVHEAKKVVEKYNNCLFRLKKACMQASLHEATVVDLRTALNECVKRIRAKDARVLPVVHIDADALNLLLKGEDTGGRKVIKMHPGQETHKVLPQKLVVVYENLFGDDGLIACVEGVVSSLEDSSSTISSALTAVEGLPIDYDGVISMLQENNVPFGKIPTAGKRFLANVATSKMLPNYLKTLGDTLKQLLEEIADAVGGEPVPAAA